METRALVVRAGARVCAVPLGHVGETLRPLAIEAVPNMPSFVCGLAIIRGLPTPVVDLATLLGAKAGSIGRFVTVQAGQRRVALAVESVVGVRALDASAAQALPPLLHGASREAIEAVGTLDAELLVVLRASKLIPDAAWQAIDMRVTP